MSKISIAELKAELPNTPTDYLESLVNFIELFNPYFPHFSKGYHIPLFEMDWLWTRIFGNPMEVSDPPRDLENLRKIEKYLNEIARMNFPYWQNMHIFYVDRKDEQYQLSERVIWDFLFTLSVHDDEARGSNNSIPLAKKIIKTFVSDAEKVIRNLPAKRNINWDAAHAISRLRTLWWRNTGKFAPKSLNPASNFAKFLRDGFQFLEISGDYVSAFRRWEIEFKSQDIELEKSTNDSKQKMRHPYDYYVK